MRPPSWDAIERILIFSSLEQYKKINILSSQAGPMKIERHFTTGRGTLNLTPGPGVTVHKHVVPIPRFKEIINFDFLSGTLLTKNNLRFFFNNYDEINIYAGGSHICIEEVNITYLLPLYSHNKKINIVLPLVKKIFIS